MQKEANNNEESLAKQAFSLFKKGFSYSFPNTFGFTLLIVALLTFGVFFPASLFLSVPFLALPLFFAYTLSLSDGHEKNELSNRRTVAYFLSYFRTPFYGSYRVIWNFFLSLLWTILFSFLLYFALVPIFSHALSDFSSSFLSFSDFLKTGNYESAYSLLSEKNSLYLFFFVYSLLDYEFFSLCFLFRLSNYSLNPFFRMRFGYGPSRLSNHIFLGSIKNKRKEFCKDIFSSTWWFYALFLGFDVLAMTIASFYLYNVLSPTGIVVFGVGIGFLAISPFLSYYVCLLNLLNKKYEVAFVDYYLHLAEETFLAAKEANELSQEEMDFYKKQIEEGKKKKEEIETGKKEDDEEENKDDHPDDSI